MKTHLNPPALDPSTVRTRVGSSYPSPYSRPCAERVRQALGDASGLSQFGVNLLTLPSGAWSSQRHWHEHEDEFVYVLEGQVVLVTDAGEQPLGPGMAAGFPAGRRDGHHLVNRSERPARVLEVGTRAPQDEGEYSDIDMKFVADGSEARFLHKNDEPY
ncbi:cupin domain-containing protein [soil metagenome]